MWTRAKGEGILPTDSTEKILLSSIIKCISLLKKITHTYGYVCAGIYILDIIKFYSVHSVIKRICYYMAVIWKLFNSCDDCWKGILVFFNEMSIICGLIFMNELHSYTFTHWAQLFSKFCYERRFLPPQSCPFAICFLRHESASNNQLSVSWFGPVFSTINNIIFHI